MKWSVRYQFLVDLPDDMEASEAHRIIDKIVKAGLKKKKRAAEHVNASGVILNETKQIKPIKPASST